MGIERLGRFSAGCRVRRGGDMGVKNYTSISCHTFLPSPPPPVAQQAMQLAQDAQKGADQIEDVTHGVLHWVCALIMGPGSGALYDGVRGTFGPGNGSPHETTPARLLAPGLSAA